jgi:hypothetical protein
VALIVIGAVIGGVVLTIGLVFLIVSLNKSGGGSSDQGGHGRRHTRRRREYDGAYP